MKTPVLTIVVPCYNEEEVLPLSSQELAQVLKDLTEQGKISDKSKILFVDDGSSDRTWALIQNLYKEAAGLFNGVKLSRNFGHQKALLAGMTEAVEGSDAILSIDADLQDDVGAIEEMVERFLEGSDVVYGVRDNRDTDTPFKRNTALAFYSLMGKLGVKLIPNHADFRLLSQRALRTLLSYKEETPFLRGMVALIGFPEAKVYYKRKERAAGESKYPLKKMITFALDGITSFSVMPIKMIRLLGCITTLIGIAYIFYTLFQKYILHSTIHGWASLIMSIWILGGLQLIALSTLGEYLGRVYSEVKNRPRFIIERNLDKES